MLNITCNNMFHVVDIHQKHVRDSESYDPLVASC